MKFAKTVFPFILLGATLAGCATSRPSVQVNINYVGAEGLQVGAKIDLTGQKDMR